MLAGCGLTEGYDPATRAPTCRPAGEDASQVVAPQPGPDASDFAMGKQGPLAGPDAAPAGPDAAELIMGDSVGPDLDAGQR
jgi:hypothetical protein